MACSRLDSKTQLKNIRLSRNYTAYIDGRMLQNRLFNVGETYMSFTEGCNENVLTEKGLFKTKKERINFSYLYHQLM